MWSFPSVHNSRQIFLILLQTLLRYLLKLSQHIYIFIRDSSAIFNWGWYPRYGVVVYIIYYLSWFHIIQRCWIFRLRMNGMRLNFFHDLDHEKDFHHFSLFFNFGDSSDSTSFLFTRGGRAVGGWDDDPSIYGLYRYVPLERVRFLRISIFNRVSFLPLWTMCSQRYL